MHIKGERRCISCKLNKQQKDMVRIAKINNDFVLDLNQKLGGRGAYICKNKTCLQTATKKHLLNKAFKMNLGGEIYKILEEYEQNI